MMKGLWGEESHTKLSVHEKATPSTPAPASRRKTAELECRYYGHTWQRIGLSNEKRCTVCGITGYCPGCTPVAPRGAQPFYCTKHTPQSTQQSEVQR